MHWVLQASHQVLLVSIKVWVVCGCEATTVVPHIGVTHARDSGGG